MTKTLLCPKCFYCLVDHYPKGALWLCPNCLKIYREKDVIEKTSNMETKGIK